MANNTNIVQVNQDKTTTYFNNYYAPQFDVSQGINDTVTSYFEKVSANKETAKALAGAVIYTAKMQNLDPMVVIKQFSAMSTGQLTPYLTMFLNLNRVGSSYLGVSNTPIANKYISRTILA